MEQEQIESEPVEHEPSQYWRGVIGGIHARVSNLDTDVFVLSLGVLSLSIAFALHLKVSHHD